MRTIFLIVILLAATLCYNSDSVSGAKMSYKSYPEMCSFWIYMRRIGDDRPIPLEDLAIHYAYSYDGETYTDNEVIQLVSPEEGLYMFSAPVAAVSVSIGIEYTDSLGALKGAGFDISTPSVGGSFNLNRWYGETVGDLGALLTETCFWDVYSEIPSQYDFYSWRGSNVPEEP